MAQLFSNNALTVMASAITSSDMVMNVRSNTGQIFPSLQSQSEDFFLITIENANASIREVISIIGRDGDTFTIGARGLEGTHPQNWEAGSIVELRLTAGFFNTQNSALNVISDQLQDLSAKTEQSISLKTEILETERDIAAKLSEQSATLSLSKADLLAIKVNTGVSNGVLQNFIHPELQLVNSNLLDVKSAIENQSIDLSPLNSTTSQVKTSVDSVNSSVGQVKSSVDTVNSTTAQVKTSVDTVNSSVGQTNSKLDQAIAILQNQLSELVSIHAASGGSATLNTSTLEAILDALIILTRQQQARFDLTGRTVIDASETVVKIDNTSPFTVSNTSTGTMIGTITYSNALDVFSTTRILYNQISVS